MLYLSARILSFVLCVSVAELYFRACWNAGSLWILTLHVSRRHFLSREIQKIQNVSFTRVGR